MSTGISNQDSGFFLSRDHIIQRPRGCSHTRLASLNISACESVPQFNTRNIRVLSAHVAYNWRYVSRSCPGRFAECGEGGGGSGSDADTNGVGITEVASKLQSQVRSILLPDTASGEFSLFFLCYCPSNVPGL